MRVHAYYNANNTLMTTISDVNMLVRLALNRTIKHNNQKLLQVNLFILKKQMSRTQIINSQ